MALARIIVPFNSRLVDIDRTFAIGDRVERGDIAEWPEVSGSVLRVGEGLFAEPLIVLGPAWQVPALHALQAASQGRAA